MNMNMEGFAAEQKNETNEKTASKINLENLQDNSVEQEQFDSQIAQELENAELAQFVGDPEMEKIVAARKMATEMALKK